MADIPLRDQIEQAMRGHLPVAIVTGPVLCICDVTLTFDGPYAHRLHVADALLEHFDIRPRGSLPVNEEP